MMRSLAAFIMRGRLQAAAVALLGIALVVFSWISAAAVALVTLRKGEREGSIVLLLVLLPSAVVAAFMSVAVDIGPLSTLVGATLAAIMLRAFQSWPLALVTASAVAYLFSLALLTVGADYTAQIQQMFAQVVAQFETQMAKQGGNAAAKITLPSTPQLVGMMGISNALSVACCLLLARWWQAMLYNPGGFREEFHALRIPPAIAGILLVVSVLLLVLGDQYQMIAAIGLIPFVVAGFALLHGTVALRKLGPQWLIMFYISWLLFSWVKLGMVLLAVVDSVVDFRGRLKARQ